MSASLLFSVSLAVLFSSFFITFSARLPMPALGFYCLIADDTISGYTSTDNWQPELYDYIINGSNVIWLTFINPLKMPAVPIAMANLAKCKGQSGCPPIDVPVIFSVGGQAYSKGKYSPWPWLESQSAAEAMAEKVATWDTEYGADGIDLDIEGQAGASHNGGGNMVHFVNKLNSLNPDFLITQPVYGYPQVDAENDVVNAGFSPNGQALGLVSSVGLMVYSNSDSLQYVADYGNATSEGNGWAIEYNVPYDQILSGIQGPATSNAILSLAASCKNEKLGGIMVWCASVYDKTHSKPAFNYGDDASVMKLTAWQTALNNMS